MGNRKFWIRLFFAAVILSALAPAGRLGAEQFSYIHRMGDRYRILSTVNEEVYVNRRLNHQAEILNRITVEVTSVEGGKGRHKAVFQTAERATDAQGEQSFQWDREYESLFDRDGRGYVTIADQYFMPVVRNVPVFPGRDLKAGDTWTAAGYEVHDFRDSFGISEPYRIPFTATYTFLGNRQWKGQSYPAFSVSYRISEKPKNTGGRIRPVEITGASDQVVYWDTELGQTKAYEENFRMIFNLSTGVTMEFRGRAQAEILESAVMDKEEAAKDIAGDLSNLGIQDVSVRVVDDGIILSLENIQFGAESATLLPSEKEKLDKIGEILLRYQDRDILVGGHTALAGTEEGRIQLSQDRAKSVAEYLIAQNIRKADRIVVRGFGAERPVADNSTDAGRQKNRRVEITILEN